MNPAHGDVKAQAAAYVLGGLEPAEKDAFEAHLPTCGECTTEVQSLRRTAGALAYAVPQRTPPAELRERVLESFKKTQAPLVTARPVRREIAGWWPLAASLILVAAVGAYGVRLQMRVGDLQSSVAVLAAPDLVRIDLAGQPTAPQSSGRALWSRARGMVFATSNLPAAPAGKSYQLWVVPAAGAPISAGLVVPDPAGGGMTYFYTPPDIPAPTAVAVTLEPAGGVPAPTGQFYLVGKAS